VKGERYSKKERGKKGKRKREKGKRGRVGIKKGKEWWT
jgi:hypothetical protein